MMKSVCPFFYPAAKKCKRSCEDKHSCEQEAKKATSIEKPREVSLPASEALHESQTTKSSDEFPTAAVVETTSEPSHPLAMDGESCVTFTTSVQNQCGQEQGSEQSSMAVAGQSHIDPSVVQPLFSSVTDLGRKWLNFQTCYHQERSRNFHFTVVSYNVLADGLLHANGYLYSSTDEWVKNWEYRKRNLLQELLFYDAHILCLQEVQDGHYQTWFEPKLKEKGYIGVYKKRTGDKSDGCAIFFKESKFTLVKTKRVSFNVPGVKLMDRDNVAVVVLLKPKATGREEHAANPSRTHLCISNTHLLFNTKRGDIKLAQLAYLFAEIDEIARISPPDEENPSYHPIICCGDFNSTPFSPIYDFVAHGYLDYKGMHRDNFSGQSYFRSNYRTRQAVSSNLIPWELGITTSSCKRIPQVRGNTERLNTTGLAENPKTPALAGNFIAGAAPCHQVLCDSLQQDSVLRNYEASQEEVAPSNSGSSTAPSKQKVFSASTVQCHKLNFFSVYKHFTGRGGGRREVTTFHDKVCTTVDYVFFSPGEQRNCHRCRTSHGLLQPTGLLRLLTEEEIWNLEGLPNRFLSSDHLSLLAGFLLHI